MKNNIINTLKDKTTQELTVELESKKSELFNLRFQLATGQLQNTAAVRACKKDIARILTVLSQREKAAN